GVGLALLDPPPAQAAAAATGLLTELGALDAAGAVTVRGRAIADVGADPRLARARLDGAGVVGARTPAEAVTRRAEDAGAGDVDLTAALRRLRAGGGSAWRREAGRWERLASRRTGQEARPGDRVTQLDLAVGLVTALAHPDRVARRRAGSD